MGERQPRGAQIWTSVVMVTSLSARTTLAFPCSSGTSSRHCHSWRALPLEGFLMNLAKNYRAQAQDAWNVLSTTSKSNPFQ